MINRLSPKYRNSAFRLFWFSTKAISRLFLQLTATIAKSRRLNWISVSAATGQNIEQLKQRLIELAPSEFREDPLLVGDLISPGDTVMMVVPIDLSAPKGRLILPQVQVLREILDCNAVAVVTKESELAASLSGLKQPPLW